MYIAYFRPRVLPIPGVDLENVFSLRTPDDANKIAAAASGKNVVVIGSSFIGRYTVLELARSFVRTNFVVNMSDLKSKLLVRDECKHLQWPPIVFIILIAYYLVTGMDLVSYKDYHTFKLK